MAMQADMIFFIISFSSLKITILAYSASLLAEIESPLALASLTQNAKLPAWVEIADSPMNLYVRLQHKADLHAHTNSPADWR
jgi:hypothetical protein